MFDNLFKKIQIRTEGFLTYQIPEEKPTFRGKKKIPNYNQGCLHPSIKNDMCDLCGRYVKPR